jgi:leucine dehydrogenase
MGGVLDAAAIARLRCRMVAGAANNPLASAEDAGRLHARGIVYVPDFLANAGALILGASNELGEGDLVAARMQALGDRVRDVLAQAAREGRSPHVVAVEQADALIARMRG